MIPMGSTLNLVRFDRKLVGGGILSGFTHYPHHLIFNSVIDPKG